MKVGIYYRKLLFFGFIFAAVFAMSRINFEKVLASVTASASLENPAVSNMSYDPYSYYLSGQLEEDGSLVFGEKSIQKAIKPRDDYDELRLIVLNEPTETYEYAKIEILLPQKVIRLVGEPTIIAVHGASPLSAHLVDGNKLVYEAQSVGQTSTVTVIAKFPKGYFNLSADEEFSRMVSSIPGLVWLVGGVFLPPFALIIFLSVFFGSRFQLLSKKTNGYISKPPSSVSPALSSIMFYGRVGPRVIMSTLVDLAQRGYIDIYNRSSDFIVYKKDNVQNLPNKLSISEQILLEKIFLPRQKKVGSMDLDARVGRHLFSRKISLMYLGLYKEAQNLGYFDKSPAKMHLRYRITGIILFFLGLLGYIVFAVYAPDPKFVLFFWIAILIMGFLVVNFSSQLTGFSKMGEVERLKWIQFRNFLSTDKVIRGRDQLFYKYLPFAIALGVEVQWASRFVESNFVPPDWYDASTPIAGIENFAKSFIPVIDYIGETLDFASDPLVN